MRMLAVISLTSPLMLLGVSAAALPLIAHLLNRRARRRIVFPTLVLLRDAAADQSKLFRMRRPLLLLLRALAVALIAMAFARPVWLAAADADAGDGASVALILDASASTAQIAAGISAVSQIRAAALRVLNDLTPGLDRANLIIARARPKPAFDEPILNIEALRDDVNKLTTTTERADFAAAIDMAATSLAARTGPRRIVVISDLQHTNWADVAVKVPAPITLSIMGVARDDAANIGMSHLTLVPAEPIVNRPAQASASLSNYSAAARTTLLQWRVDDQLVASTKIELAPWEQRDVVTDLMLLSPGFHRIAASVSPDDLPSDDSVGLVVEAVDRVPIVVVGDDDPSQPDGSSYYLLRALAPRGDATDALQVTHLRSDAVSDVTLRSAQAVLIGDVGPLPETAVRSLVNYIRHGGGVLLFAGPGPVAANVQSLAATALPDGLTPFAPLTLREDALVHIDEGKWSRPPLDVFDELSQLAISQLPITHTYAAGPLAADAAALLRYDDRTPALAEISLGDGRFMLANFSPSPRFGDLARRGVFVALMQSLVNHLRPKHLSNDTRLAGQPLSITISHPSSRFTALGPDDRTVPIQVVSTLGSATLTLPDASQTGFYTIFDGERPVHYLAVNPDPRESDLRQSDPRVLQASLKAGGAAVAVNGATDDVPLELRGRPLWYWFVLASMGVFAVEMLLLRKYSR
ncbi:MAG: hypothetical protein GC162_18205 [Planctomycetes bacterium]|nr:hypothetical protein [Planctomycetota bacterium]